jgi:hypothetical protein
VQDDLDPEDRTITVEEMTAIGYTAVGEDTNVSTSALNEALARTDVTTLYHTGHGFEGSVATSDGQIIASSGGTINVQNAIFAACLSLTENWSSRMGASCNTVLGYTEVSYDILDNDVARTFARALGEGSSYMRSWYSANVIDSMVSDRWCGYVREASGIVEYSARTGNVPQASYGGGLEQVDPKIWVISDLLADSQTFASEFAPLQIYEYVVAGDEDHVVQFRGGSSEFVTKSPVASASAVQTADAWLGAELPADASLDAANALDAKVASGPSTTAAYRVRYERVIDGMRVLSNGRGHHIEVVVDASGVAAVSRFWPTLDTLPANPSSPLLGVNVALASAIDEIRLLVKEPVSFVDVMPCYGSMDFGEIVPAYAFLDHQGNRIVVNARTGDLVL